MKRPNMLRRTARGFGLVEIMIALVLASFLMLGLATMVANVQGTYSNQSEFAAINDKERYAASLLQNLIMTSGYYSLSQVSQSTLNTGSMPTIQGALPSESGTGYSYIAGQGISGSYSSTGADTLNVRFQANTSDNGSPFNCLGQTAAATGGTGSSALTVGVYESQLSISSAGNLVCQTGIGIIGLGSTQTVLIDGVTNMKILYGLDTLNKGYVTQYVNASSIAGANWFLVRSVQVTLTFKATTLANNTQPTFTQIYQVKYSENSQQL